MRRIRAFLMALVLVMALSPASLVKAASADSPSGGNQITTQQKKDYFSSNFKYKVRIYAGNQGKFVVGGVKYDLVTINAKPGTQVDITNYWIENTSGGYMQLNNDTKHYAKGIREAGKDNSVAVSRGSKFTITQDMDYVVAYGLRGGDVAYTIEYVDADGKQLAPPETHYGNEGEKPVVAFKYINGYVPQALNLTKTLSSDTSKNVFRFTYVPGDSSQYIYNFTDNGTEIVYIDGGTQGGGGTTTTNGNVNIVTNQNPNGENELEITIDDEQTPQAGGNATPEIIDLDDGSVPLAGNDLDFEYVEPEADKVGVGGLPLGVKLLLGGCGVALVGAVTGLVLLNKKKKEEDE